MPEKKVLETPDLESHKRENPNQAHGIMALIRAKIPPREDAYVNVYLATDHTGLTANDWEQVMLDTETEDAAGLFGSSLFTAPAAGLYIVTACATIQNNGAAAQKFRVGIFKAGALLLQGGRDDEVTNGSLARGLTLSAVVRLVVGDTVGLYIYCTTANNMKILGGSTLTWLRIAMLR
jgi:hypothetical protein